MTAPRPLALGDSHFNYSDYTAARFLHYFQSVHHVMALHPKSLLEIGPGDHTVSDFFARKGVTVRTFDNDERLRPDYIGDLREPLPISERFDVVLASEVFEHFQFADLERILRNIEPVLGPRGHLVVSLPYSTIRLFPPRPRYGRVLSCEGRLHTGMPTYVIQAGLTVARGFYRTVRLREHPRKAFAFYRSFPNYPADRHDVHHWDLGVWPTTRRRVRQVFARFFDVIDERPYLGTNCVFFVLQARS
ncbi:MAG: methyltransferase domain-containing protein [Candidatus Rokubacteria bacterium]|nr:methyltransferase domain-containing protein [Candidatus Rokubacteria bacterium]